MSSHNVDIRFDAILNQYGKNLYWHIRRLVVGHEDAEDAFQEMCIKIYRSLDRYRGGEDQIRPWLYKIATNEALMVLRRKTRFFQSIDTLAPSLADLLMEENASMVNSPEMLLQKAILTLPATQRIIFNMRYFDEMTYEDIASVTGKNTGTLKTNYHYATEHIKKYIKENS